MGMIIWARKVRKGLCEEVAYEMAPERLFKARCKCQRDPQVHWGYVS